MEIPLESTEAQTFTPDSLKSLANPPTFTFRVGEYRDKARHALALKEERLHYYSEAEVRAETLDACRALYSVEEYTAVANRLETFWAMIDENRRLDEADRTPMADVEMKAIADLGDRLLDAWPALARMDAKNSEFLDASPLVTMSMFIVGWNGVDVPFARVAGRVPLERIAKMIEAVGKVAEKAIADGVEGVVHPLMPILELIGRARAELNLEKRDEKNSEPLSSSQENRNGSKTSDSGTKAAGSSLPVLASRSTGKKTRRAPAAKTQS